MPEPAFLLSTSSTTTTTSHENSAVTNSDSSQHRSSSLTVAAERATIILQRRQQQQQEEEQPTTRAGRRKRQRRRRSSSHNMDRVVAEEIETVIFGESDDEHDEEEEGDSDGDGACGSSEEDNDYSPYSHYYGAGFGYVGCESTGTGLRCRWRTIRTTKNEAYRNETMNSYGLFDNHPIVHQQGRRRPSQTQTRRRRPSTGSIVIYAKKYQSPGALFVPILFFLAGTFAVLVAIRLLVILLTAVVGIVVLALLSVRLVQEFWTRPVRLVRRLHRSPVICFASLGAVMGAVHVLWVQRLFPLSLAIVASTTSRLPEGLGRGIREWLVIEGATAASSPQECYGIDVDLIMLWRLLRGLGYGIEIGSLWLIIFGNTSNSTALGRYMYRNIWKPLKRQYRQSAAIRDDERHAPSSSMEFANVLCHEFREDQGGNRRHCSICLEKFDDGTREEWLTEDDGIDDAPPMPDTYQLLPCNHCFHRECARHWLTIQQTCPICRVEVQGMRGCGISEEAGAETRRSAAIVLSK